MGEVHSESQVMSAPQLVAAIPCLNTEPFIADVIARARRFVDHVIVIDDGSQDDTAAVARAAGATVISHKSNRGYGAAINTCFETARAIGATALVTLDGDGQHDPADIPGVLGPVVRGETDLVIGSRFIASGHAVPRYRRFGIDVITLLWNLGSKVKTSDSQSGFRAYGPRLIETLSLSEQGMAASIEILEKARKRRVLIAERPVSCSYGQPTFGVQAIRHGLSVALSVLRIRLKNRQPKCDDCMK